MLVPRTRIAPECVGTRPAMALISVDLPAPFGPSTVTISPVFTCRLMPRRMGTSGT
jgi:hypothetical protein